MTTYRTFTGPVLLAACLIASGCGAPTEETQATKLEALRRAIAENLPKGWQIGFGKDSGVAFVAPTQPDDILVWKTDKVLLRKRGGMAEDDAPASAPAPVHVYFTISPRPFIEPDAYAGVHKSNLAVKAMHDHWLKTVSHIPRNANGDIMPRGTEESEQVGKFKANYPKLPPYDPDEPTHHFRGMAFKLRDWRTVQEPEDRTAQTEMNTAYVAITKAMTPYRR
jgi:hypothetical protein